MIRGSTTVGEAAGRAGMCVKHLCRLLKLPEDTPADARLGPLIREAGMEMSAARRLLEEASAGGSPPCDHGP
jgi:hypothetical protein